jgi:hypothetical protein
MPALRRPDRPDAPRLKLHRPDPEVLAPKDVVYWRINGHRAAMLIWTDAEFEQLADWERPGDAQHFSCGIWTVLRMV